MRRPTAALALTVLLLAFATGASAQEPRPDIVVVMLDDWAAGPATRVLDRLPALSRMFRDDGLHLSEMYGETPLCCPGRAGFLTGQHTRHHGVTVQDARLLRHGDTLPRYLRDAGYRTGSVGKYLNAAQLLPDPPAVWDWWRPMDPQHTYHHASWWTGASWDQIDRYVTDVTGDKAVRFIEATPAGQPMFLWLSFFAPHVPIEPAERHVGDQRCDGVGLYEPPGYASASHPKGWPLRPVCETLLAVDEAVAQVKAAMIARGRGDVLWLLTADNGMAYGHKGVDGKGVPWSTRLDTYVRWRGVTGRSSALLSNIDIAPTIAEVAGVTMPDADGESFLPLLLGQPFAGRADLLEDHPAPKEVEPWSALRTPRWHYVEWGGGARDLFDLDADPWELDDLHGAPAHDAIEARLATRLEELR